MTRDRHKATGPVTAFSLTELVAVIAITGILAALAIPRFANAAALQRAEAAARRVSADLNLMQRLAKASSAPHRLRFLTSTNKYVIEFTTNGSDWTSIPDADRPNSGYQVDLGLSPYEVAVVTTDGLVECDAFGAPKADFGVTFRSGAKWLAVKLTASTGEIASTFAVFEANPGP